MPLFQISDDSLKLIRPAEFTLEKKLQHLIEKNLSTVFNCRLIATEYSTGTEHAGRMDSLALSEDNNPVIIEYKKVESSDLINQSLFYLAWLKDHKGDFEVAVRKALGEVSIDWSEIRTICIAPGFKKYDLLAVQTMGVDIELWRYNLYENGSFILEEVFRRSAITTAGKKAAETRANGEYTVDEVIRHSTGSTQDLFYDLQAYIMQLDETIEETPKKYYIAYKVSQNFVCIEPRKSKLILTLKINPKEASSYPNSRDVSSIGHAGTGDFEYTLAKAEDMDMAKKLIKVSLDVIGG